MPIAAPTSGATVCPEARAAVHRNRVVSRPSRPTDRNAVIVSAPVPIAAARATSPRRCEDRVAAVRRIQKIIAVTRPTANTLSRPPTASWPALESTLTENVSTAANAPDSVTAPSTPSQIGAVETRRLAVAVCLRGRRLLHGRQQDGHHEAGLEALAEPDQEVRNAVCPSHADQGKAYLTTLSTGSDVAH